MRDIYKSALEIAKKVNFGDSPFYNFVYGYLNSLCENDKKYLEVDNRKKSDINFLNGFILGKIKIRNNSLIIEKKNEHTLNLKETTVLIKCVNFIIHLKKYQDLNDIDENNNELNLEFFQLIGDINTLLNRTLQTSRIIACIAVALLELFYIPHFPSTFKEKIKPLRMKIKKMTSSFLNSERTAEILALTTSATTLGVENFVQYATDEDHNTRRGFAIALPFLDIPLNKCIDSERFRNTIFGEVLMGVHLSTLMKALILERTKLSKNNKLSEDYVKTIQNDFNHSHSEARMAAALAYIGSSSTPEDFLDRIEECFENHSVNIKMGALYGIRFLLFKKNFFNEISIIRKKISKFFNQSHQEIIHAAALSCSLYCINSKNINLAIKTLINMSNSKDNFTVSCSLLGLCMLYHKTQIFNQDQIEENLGLKNTFLFYSFIIMSFIDIFYQWMDLGAFLLFSIVYLKNHFFSEY